MSSSAVSQFSTDTGSYYNYETLPYENHNDFLNFFSGGEYNSWVDNVNSSRADKNSRASQAAASALDQDRIDKAREYEIWFDSSKYQRAVEDLKAAGLNPWLAVQGGLSGTGSTSASTNNSSSASNVNKPNSKSSNNGLSNLLSSALKIIMAAAILG